MASPSHRFGLAARNLSLPTPPGPRKLRLLRNNTDDILSKSMYVYIYIYIYIHLTFIHFYSIAYAHSALPKSLTCGVVGCGCGCVLFWPRRSIGVKKTSQEDPFLIFPAHFSYGGTKEDPEINTNNKQASRTNAKMNS